MAEVIHELSHGVQRLADALRKERFRSDLQNLLSDRKGCAGCQARVRYAGPAYT